MSGWVFILPVLHRSCWRNSFPRDTISWREGRYSASVQCLTLFQPELECIGEIGEPVDSCNQHGEAFPTHCPRIISYTHLPHFSPDYPPSRVSYPVSSVYPSSRSWVFGGRPRPSFTRDAVVNDRLWYLGNRPASKTIFQWIPFQSSLTKPVGYWVSGTFPWIWWIQRRSFCRNDSHNTPRWCWQSLEL